MKLLGDVIKGKWQTLEIVEYFISQRQYVSVKAGDVDGYWIIEVEEKNISVLRSFARLTRGC
jgi:hypothetical protein